jgi:hypothetical protein
VKLLRLAAAASLLLALAVPSAHAASKAGHAYLAPAPVAADDPAPLARARHALLELDRVRGGEAAALLRRNGGRLISPAQQLWVVPGPAAARLLPRLIVSGLLRSAQPDRALFAPTASSFTPDPLAPHEWWRPAIRADQLEPPAGPGRPVTVVDSGVDAAHPEFAGRANTVLLNPQLLDEGFEGDVHGTAVASLVGAPANGIGIAGVYPAALVQAWDAGGDGGPNGEAMIPTSRVIEGIAAASARGAGVINLSLGMPQYQRVLHDAVLLAVARGSLVVASSGNDFDRGNPLNFPANLPHVLTVAATSPSDTSSSFSSSSNGVDLAAPGEEIPVAAPGFAGPDGLPYAFFDGTSFSAPLVSGAASWVWAARPSLDNTQLFDLLRLSARDIAEPGWDEHTGFGVLDVAAALSAAAPRKDWREPNDDISHVTANGLFRQAATPMTRPGKRTATFRARLDLTEDPEDVYRVWVPARSRVRIRVTPSAGVDVDLWRSTARTVLARGAARRRDLLATSSRAGKAVETVTAVNRAARGVWVYLDVFLRENGPLDDTYAVTISTARAPARR